MYFKKLYLTEASIFDNNQLKQIEDANKPFLKDAATQRAKDLNLTKKETKNYLKDQKAKATSSAQKAIELIKKGEVKGFENFQDWGPTFKTLFLQILSEDGYDTRTNPFLTFAKLVARTDITQLGNNALKAFNEIRTQLKNGSLRLQNANLNNQHYEWLADKDSYIADDPEYKVKTLIFFTSPNAKNFGEVRDIPWDKVRSSKSKREIQALVAGWQTKDGEDADTDNYTGKNNKGYLKGKLGNKGKINPNLKFTDGKKAAAEFANAYDIEKDKKAKQIYNAILKIKSDTKITLTDFIGRALMKLANLEFEPAENTAATGEASTSKTPTANTKTNT